MRWLELDFLTNTMELRWEGQEGTQYAPELDGAAPKILSALSLPNLPDKAILNFDEKQVALTYNLPDMDDRESAILEAVGMERADLGNVVDLVRALLGGKVSMDVFEDAMEMESRQNEKNPAVSALLEDLLQE